MLRSAPRRERVPAERERYGVFADGQRVSGGVAAEGDGVGRVEIEECVGEELGTPSVQLEASCQDPPPSCHSVSAFAAVEATAAQARERDACAALRPRVRRNGLDCTTNPPQAPRRGRYPGDTPPHCLLFREPADVRRIFANVSKPHEPSQAKVAKNRVNRPFCPNVICATLRGTPLASPQSENPMRMPTCRRPPVNSSSID